VVSGEPRLKNRDSEIGADRDKSLATPHALLLAQSLVQFLIRCKPSLAKCVRNSAWVCAVPVTMEASLRKVVADSITHQNNFILPLGTIEASGRGRRGGRATSGCGFFRRLRLKAAKRLWKSSRLLVDK